MCIAFNQLPDGRILAAWRGTPLGWLDYVSGNVVAGELSYRGARWSTDAFGRSGIPAHWVEPKIAAWCRQVDARAMESAA